MSASQNAAAVTFVSGPAADDSVIRQARSRRLASRLLPVAALALAIPALPAAARHHQAGSSEGVPEAAKTREIVVDTREGTWMNLDLSPDGQWLVFDLLGDIFLMPAAGGEATALLSGPAYEHQPRFSPDGKRIAFSSDRSGAENIWTLALRGRALRQVTRETNRTVSGPAWSRDGTRIVARKHVTGQRSIGTGQLWLFPAEGGAGRLLYARSGYQKDVNEPVFSVDGGSVFFSQDATPGDTFEYSRDPYRGIFSIWRLDLAGGAVATVIGAASRQDLGSGARTEVIGSPGGAVRPAPSPDGRRLAFVKRLTPEPGGRSSALVVRDLESGAERIVHRGLDEDLQELWANHGYYPAYAWTPDGAAIVFWAGGGLHRLDLATGATVGIPFHVRQTHQVVDPTPLSIEADAPAFPVRALRDTQIAPAGDRVAFQALGRIWLRDLATGAVERLTSQETESEFQPRFTPDGQSLVYVTWNDRDLGSVRRTRIADRATVVVVDGRGKYVEPSVSADGAKLWFRRIGLAPLLSPRWSADPGLYEVPLAGGAARRLQALGNARQPQSCRGDGRMFVAETRPNPAGMGGSRARLVAHDFGRPEGELIADLPDADEFRVSGDCRWLAWTDHDDVHALMLQRDASGRVLPVTEAAIRDAATAPGDGGAYLGWDGQGVLHWSLGAELHSWQPGAAPPLRRGIGFTASADPGARTPVLLAGARIITQRGDEVIERGDVLIEGRRILDVGTSGTLRVPASARWIDVSGKTLIPGLIDAHWHGTHASEGLQPGQNWEYLSTLGYGVTTILDPSAPQDAYASAELARAGSILAPRIFTTGPILYGPPSAEGSSGTTRVESLDDARRQVRRRLAWGGRFLKLYLMPRREQEQWLLAAAREHGMGVLSEGAMGPLNLVAHLTDGTHSAEHGLSLGQVYDDLIQLWSRTRVANVPTLLVSTGGLGGDVYNYGRARVWKDRILARLVPPDHLLSTSVRWLHVWPEDNRAVRSAGWVKRLADAGTRTVTGAHGMREGLGMHWEMAALVDGGMSPREALAAATIRGAEHLGMSAELGSIEKGKLADIVVLERNPLQDIRDSATVAMVIAGGRVIEVPDMQVLGQPARAPWFWEEPGVEDGP